MRQGFVLTQYLYTELIAFEKTPASLKESIGEMVYGMDVNEEMSRVKKIEFVEEGTPDVVREVTVKPSGLDMAEMYLVKHDPKSATGLAETALKQHVSDPARADFILARADLLTGQVDDATSAFHEALRLGSDPRLLAWSHIYLGQIFDVQDERNQAVADIRPRWLCPTSSRI